MSPPSKAVMGPGAMRAGEARKRLNSYRSRCALSKVTRATLLGPLRFRLSIIILLSGKLDVSKDYVR